MITKGDNGDTCEIFAISYLYVHIVFLQGGKADFGDVSQSCSFHIHHKHKARDCAVFAQRYILQHEPSGEAVFAGELGRILIQQASNHHNIPMLVSVGQRHHLSVTAKRGILKKKPFHLGLQTSAAKRLRTAVFRAITQRVVVDYYRRFGKTYQSHLQGSRIRILSLEDGTGQLNSRFHTKIFYDSFLT